MRKKDTTLTMHAPTKTTLDLRALATTDFLTCVVSVPAAASECRPAPGLRREAIARHAANAVPTRPGAARGVKRPRRAALQGARFLTVFRESSSKKAESGSSGRRAAD